MNLDKAKEKLDEAKDKIVEAFEDMKDSTGDSATDAENKLHELKGRLDEKLDK